MISGHNQYLAHCFLLLVGSGGSTIIKGAGKGVGQIVGGGKFFVLCSYFNLQTLVF